MHFFAIDVETANPNRRSICQIGLAEFKDGEVVDELDLLVNPEEEFGPQQIKVHGIRPENVLDSPAFNSALEIFSHRIDKAFLVCHSSFDRIAVRKAAEKYGVSFPQTFWLDTLRIARRMWPDLPSFRLSDLAEKFGMNFKHHHAIEDAKVCGRILIKAIHESGLDLTKWHEERERANQTCAADRSSRAAKNRKYPEAVTRKGAVDGLYAGQAIVFTGALNNLGMTRGEAADLASMVGFDVKAQVSKKVKYVVVGEHDLRQLAGHSKSSKMRKAIELQNKGHDIDLIGEIDFMALLEDVTASDQTFVT